MTLSELIAEAEKVLQEQGDIRVAISDPGCSCCASGDYDPAETRVREDVHIWENGERGKAETAFVVS